MIDKKQIEKFKMCMISFYMRVLDFKSILSSDQFNSIEKLSLYQIIWNFIIAKKCSI